MQDKLRFEDKLSTAGIPTVRTLFQLCRTGLKDRLGADVGFADFVARIDAMKLAKGIIVKPRAGGSGSAVFKMTVCDGILLHQGRPLGEDDFLALVFTTNNGALWDEFLIQETIAQHAELDRFNETSVNTVRIDTFIDENGGIRFNAAALKIGMPGSITDNVTSGGYMAGIDLQTGKFSSGAKADARFGGQYHDLTVLYGIDPQEFVMPHWDEVIGLARKAAECLLPFRVLGWDIAISKDGPLVIETNFDYGVDVLQELAGGYIDTPLGQAYLNHHAADKAAILQALR